MSDGTELWRPIPGYEDYYEVSDLGRVRSHDRWVESANRWGGSHRYLKRGRVLRQKFKTAAQHAYRNVILSVNAVHETRQVHRLVLEVFVGPSPAGQEACHNNGDLTDNRLANLRWDTRSENAQDRLRHGTDPRANMIVCVHGHELAAPNLDPTFDRMGYRRCFACALTTMWGRKRQLAVGSVEWLTEADRRFAEIVHFGAPLNYRLRENRRPGGVRWTPGCTW